MTRPVLVVLAVVGLVVLGAGGYLLRGEMRCNALEDDYVNAASSMHSNAAVRGIAEAGGDLDQAIDVLQEHELARAEEAMTLLYAECGERAARTAQRKGSEALLGS